MVEIHAFAFPISYGVARTRNSETVGKFVRQYLEPVQQSRERNTRRAYLKHFKHNKYNIYVGEQKGLVNVILKFS